MLILFRIYALNLQHRVKDDDIVREINLEMQQHVARK